MVDENKRYSISDVSRMVEVPAHQLRQWESRIPQLKPKRDRANRRYYLAGDIDIVRRVKQLIRHEKLTTEGVINRLNQELYGEGRPRTRREIIDLLDRMEVRIRDMFDLLGPQ